MMPDHASIEGLMAGGDVTPLQLKALLDKNPDLYILDVREPSELGICRLENSRDIPLGILPLRYAEVPREKPVIVLCKMGGRSAQAVQFLKGKGYTHVSNLVGGILRWIDEVDPSLKKY
jgi:sulfur-carrier protein adenylyltransferase/sulfurtransferase